MESWKDGRVRIKLGYERFGLERAKVDNENVLVGYCDQREDWFSLRYDFLSFVTSVLQCFLEISITITKLMRSLASPYRTIKTFFFSLQAHLLHADAYDFAHTVVCLAYVRVNAFFPFQK